MKQLQKREVNMYQNKNTGEITNIPSKHTETLKLYNTDYQKEDNSKYASKRKTFNYIRIKNKFTKEVKKFRTQSEMAKEFNCSTGMVANLIHGRTKIFAGCWKLHNHPVTKPHRRIK